MNNRPLCLVLMPFGKKKDPSGGPEIDFDRIYERAIRPAIEAAALEPIRADGESTGGIIHKAMFEGLLLCDFAVADLTTANANVFYELGVRHAVRPATTLAIFASSHTPPFDVNYLRGLPYVIGDQNAFDDDCADKLKESLTQRLNVLRAEAKTNAVVDSPLFQLLDGYKAPDIAHLKTDTFREQLHYSTEIKNKLSVARNQQDVAQVEAVEHSLGPMDGVEGGVLVDLFLSYRALSKWNPMITLYKKLPVTLQRSVLVREQLGFALNRAGEKQQALAVLEEIVKERGPSSETCGLIGRVYKDLWGQENKAGNAFKAEGFLDLAIESYLRGFEADWRDGYPGVNAVTLLEIKGDEEALEKQKEILPVVKYSVEQKVRKSKPDYWDYATLLELAVLANDSKEATKMLKKSLAAVRESWEPQTTANNLEMIRAARSARGIDQDWLGDILDTLKTSGVPGA